MQQAEKRHQVVQYYDEHVQHKLNDFIAVNPRIEAAWATLIKFAGKKPAKILEVGCGIGSVAHRINRRWPKAMVRGIDISPLSIDIAKKLFSNSQVTFTSGELRVDTFEEKFDLIILMDVYEHISPEARSELHSSIKRLLKHQGKIFLSVPTPSYLQWLRKHKPENIQPVDENITIDVVSKLANETSTDVVYYELKSIWGIKDYAHILLERHDEIEGCYNQSKPISFQDRTLRILRKAGYKLGSFLRKHYVRSKFQ